MNTEGPTSWRRVLGVAAALLLGVPGGGMPWLGADRHFAAGYLLNKGYPRLNNGM